MFSNDGVAVALTPAEKAAKKAVRKARMKANKAGESGARQADKAAMQADMAGRITDKATRSADIAGGRPNELADVIDLGTATIDPEIAETYQEGGENTILVGEEGVGSEAKQSGVVNNTISLQTNTANVKSIPSGGDGLTSYEGKLPFKEGVPEMAIRPSGDIGTTSPIGP
ncbi:MAG: hypothetical protein QF732_11410 [Nitrospinaceae bacterium]|nr:hypothetical protein [Nitrospinaceae bacterium]